MGPILLAQTLMTILQSLLSNEMGRNLCIEYKSSSFGRTATLMSIQKSGWDSMSVTKFAIFAMEMASGPGRAL